MTLWTILAFVLGFCLGALGFGWGIFTRVKNGHDLRWVSGAVEWVKR